MEQQLERASKAAGRAVGMIHTALVKRTITKGGLRDILQELREATTTVAELIGEAEHGQ